MKYMLDTNIVVYVRNARPAAVLERFRRYRPEDLCVSAITLAELEYGAARSSRPEQNRLALMLFFSNISVLPFDADAAREYGTIRCALESDGTPIGANDCLIASHARSRGLTLITNNTREFERVPGLRIENWAR
jgi:tRNA(fMet)-specific endonuclease VapC